MTRLLQALYGILATLVGMAAAHLVAALTVPAASPVLAVGSTVIDLTPTPVKEWAIRTFGTADKLPLDNNLPMTVVRGDRIYLIGGETGGGTVDAEYFGHHPELVLVGQIGFPN